MGERWQKKDGWINKITGKELFGFSSCDDPADLSPFGEC
jgi:hypothetical protein